MNIKRLNLMVTMLQEVVDGTWKATNRIKVAFHDCEDKEDKNKDEFDLWHWVEATSKPCGYSACAVGHALLDKRFVKQGLKPNTENPDNIFPTFEDRTYLGAVCKFFCIGKDIAENLFIPSHYSDHLKDKKLATQVLRRIKKLLEVGEEKYYASMIDFSDDVNIWYQPSDRMISPQGRIYNYKPRG